MEPQQIFDEACIAFGLGKRLNIEDFPDVPAFPAYERTRHHADELIASANEHLVSLPQIHFDFIESSEINAVAFKRKGQYFIGVTAGALVMLHLVLDRILADRSTFPDVGDADGERDDLPSVPWCIIDPKRLFGMGVRPMVPRDAKRILYSKHLADQALLFLIGHEIAHISRGHVDYWDASRGSGFIAELGWTGSGDLAMERQAMEADADRRSIYARSNSMYMTAKQAVGTPPPWDDTPAPVEAYQYNWAFGVNVLFRLFGDKRFAGTNLEASTYPPVPLRQKMAMDYAAQVLLDNWGTENEEKINAATFGTSKAAEFCFRAIGAGPSEGGHSDASTLDSEKHVKKIRNCWSQLKNKLQPFSHEELDQ